jgi:predicted Zn-dependent protease
MRATLLLMPLLIGAAPALAQPAPAAAPPAAAEVQRALANPAMADRLADAMQALSDSLLDLPVGEVQAAVEGRKPTAAERKLTVRDLGRRDDPNFERNLHRQIAQSGPMIRQSMKALAEALPVMMKSMEEAGKALERAAANMPDPTYPKR